MAFDAHKNLAIGTVTTAPGTAGLSLTVASGEGARFPAAPFNCTVWPASVAPLPTNAEIVRVTARAGDVFTIARAQEGTTAKPIAVGYLISNTATAKIFTDLETGLETGLAGIGVLKQEPFNAANYSGVAPMTWTVGAPAVVANQYARIGNILIWSVYISWFSGSNVLGGSPSTGLRMMLPGGSVSGPQSVIITRSHGTAGVPVIAGLFGSCTGNGGEFLIEKSAGGNFALSDIPGFIFTAVVLVG